MKFLGWLFFMAFSLAFSQEGCPHPEDLGYSTLSHVASQKDENRVFWKREESYLVNEVLWVGQRIKISRCLPPGIWVDVAYGKILKMNGLMVEGGVSYEGNYSEELGNLYPQAMKGDYVFGVSSQILSNHIISPRKYVSLDSIFHISQNQILFSPQASQELDALLEQMPLEKGRLHVMVYDHELLHDESLYQTQIMAQAILQYYSSKYGFPKERLWVIGVGQLMLKEQINRVDIPSRGLLVTVVP